MRNLTFFAFLLAGCPGDPASDTDTDTDTDTDAVGLEIAGTYTDDFDGVHTISDTEWNMDGVGSFAIATYDNDADFAIAQNDSGNEFFPDSWSRFDWSMDGADLYFCQTTFDAPSEADAENTPRADDTDLEGGCGGFSWSRLQ